MTFSQHIPNPAKPDTHAHSHANAWKKYVLIWAMLMVLTGVTILVARFDFGQWNIFVALAVATVKVTLVALFFMHLWDDDKFFIVIFVGCLLFVALFFIPTVLDVKSAGVMDGKFGKTVDEHYFIHKKRADKKRLGEKSPDKCEYPDTTQIPDFKE